MGLFSGLSGLFGQSDGGSKDDAGPSGWQRFAQELGNASNGLNAAQDYLNGNWQSGSALLARARARRLALGGGATGPVVQKQGGVLPDPNAAVGMKDGGDGADPGAFGAPGPADAGAAGPNIQDSALFRGRPYYKIGGAWFDSPWGH
jgi:hypothetical protein